MTGLYETSANALAVLCRTLLERSIKMQQCHSHQTSNAKGCRVKQERSAKQLASGALFDMRRLPGWDLALLSVKSGMAKDGAVAALSATNTQVPMCSSSPSNLAATTTLTIQACLQAAASIQSVCNCGVPAVHGLISLCDLLQILLPFARLQQLPHGRVLGHHCHDRWRRGGHGDVCTLGTSRSVARF